MEDCEQSDSSGTMTPLSTGHSVPTSRAYGIIIHLHSGRRYDHGLDITYLHYHGGYE